METSALIARLGGLLSSLGLVISFPFYRSYVIHDSHTPRPLRVETWSCKRRSALGEEGMYSLSCRDRGVDLAWSGPLDQSRFLDRGSQQSYTFYFSSSCLPQSTISPASIPTHLRSKVFIPFHLSPPSHISPPPFLNVFHLLFVCANFPPFNFLLLQFPQAPSVPYPSPEKAKDTPHDTEQIKAKQSKAK
jgi:hypothetical protein